MAAIIVAVMLGILLQAYAQGNEVNLKSIIEPERSEYGSFEPLNLGFTLSHNSELPLKMTYDGVNDDLLSAGLGIKGMLGKEAPKFAAPENPTSAELRRLAIYNNFRTLVDPSPQYLGKIYGPGANHDRDLIAGEEYLAYADDGSGQQNVTLMVQIPSTFEPSNACIVTGTSSGSRGVYGAIGTSGEWGLKKGCVVVYNDKGTGMGVHDLETNTINLINGLREDADKAGKLSNFTTMTDKAKREVFNRKFPHRVAFKHAHSQQNPEKDWGKNVLQSLHFAFYILNQKYGIGTITPENTIVIASSVSNGGGGALRAAEQDVDGLIDGIAVSEPNVTPTYNDSFKIVQGNNLPVTKHSRPLIDYYTLLHVYQPCANLANLMAPFNVGNPPGFPWARDLGENRCKSLKEKGLLKADNVEEQAEEAQKIINDYGLLVEQNILQPSHHTFNLVRSISVTYANQYGRFDVSDNLCGYSFGATDEEGQPVEADKETLAAIFSTGNGIPPTGGLNLINNNSVGGPLEDRVSISPSTNRKDQNLDGALCLRRIVTGVEPVSGKPVTGKEWEQHQRIQKGVSEILATGNLQGKPTIIVNGRSDAVLAPNHTSRAYFGLNKIVEGAESKLRYYEVVNAHHLDALNQLYTMPEKSGTDVLYYAPLHYYFTQGLDLMYDHLKNGTPLSPSQVVRNQPPDELGGIQATPDSSDLITFQNNTVMIPE